MIATHRNREVLPPALRPKTRLWLRRGRSTPCMQKLERLPWIDGFALTGHGVRVGVRVNDASLLPQLRERLPPGVGVGKDGVVDRMISVWSPLSQGSGRTREYEVLYADHVRVGRSFDLEPILDLYDSHVRIAIAQFARPNLFVHAGAVAWKGKAVIFPGPSLSGKSHLVAELTRAGAAYCSDEYAILDRDGKVHPFPKPISLRAHRSAPQHDFPVDGDSVASEPTPVVLAVFCEYVPGAGWRPERLSRGQAMLRLLENTFSARERPREAVEILERVVTHAVSIQCKRDDAARISAAVLSSVENPEELEQWN